jgi:hypothetical protein
MAFLAEESPSQAMTLARALMDPFARASNLPSDELHSPFSFNLQDHKRWQGRV